MAETDIGTRPDVAPDEYDLQRAIHGLHGIFWALTMLSTERLARELWRRRKRSRVRGQSEKDRQAALQDQRQLKLSFDRT